MFKRRSKTQAKSQKRGEPQYGNFMHIEPTLAHLEATTTGATRRVSQADLCTTNRGHIAESTRIFANLLTKHIQVYAEPDLPRRRQMDPRLEDQDADDFRGIFSNSTVGSVSSSQSKVRRNTQFIHPKFRQKDASNYAAADEDNSSAGRSAESPKAVRDRSDESGILVPGAPVVAAAVTAACAEPLHEKHADGSMAEIVEGAQCAAKMSLSSNKLTVPLAVARHPSSTRGAGAGGRSAQGTTSSRASSVSFTPDTGSPGESDNKRPRDWQKEPHHGFTASVLNKMGFMRRRGRAPFYSGGAGLFTGESCVGALTKLEKDVRGDKHYSATSRAAPHNSASFADGSIHFTPAGPSTSTIVTPTS